MKWEKVRKAKQRKERYDTGIRQTRSADHHQLGGGPAISAKISRCRSHMSSSSEFTHQTPNDQTAQHSFTRVMSLQRSSIKIAEDHGRHMGLRFETPMPEAHLPQIRHWGSSQKQKPTIRIFAVYEHDLNRKRAQLMQEELTRRLGHSFNFSVSWWRLKSYWHPKMRQVAADAISKADIILFALRPGGELPQTLTKWIEERLFHKTTHRVALLALVKTGGMIVPLLSPAEIYLRHLASRAGLDCLCYSDSISLTRTNCPRKVRLSVGKVLNRSL
jgi:hypothetical protein